MHEEISKGLEVDYYFAHPYASYERGSVENLNGLIRQYIPKGKYFDDVDNHFIKEVEEKLNNRPRKILNFLTPQEFCETFNEYSELGLRLSI